MPIFENVFTGRSFLTSGKQAQQNYRFVLRIAGVDAALIQDVTAPSYTVETETVSILDYKFKYPTTAKWNGEVTFNIIQVIDNNLLQVATTLSFFMQKLNNPRYYVNPMTIRESGDVSLALPNDFYNAKDTITNFTENGLSKGYVKKSDEGTVLDFSKQKLTNALRRIEIRTLNEDGQIYESWRLNNAFITSVTPDNFNYSSETISKISVKVSYDWASYGFKGVYTDDSVSDKILGLL